MSDFINRAKSRMNRNGTNVGEVYENNTSMFIRRTFKESPTYRRAKVMSNQFPDISEMDVRVINVERMGSLREILFMPNEGLNIGTYLYFDGYYWLLTDSWGSVETMQQKALAQRCNHILKWSTKATWLDENNELIDDVVKEAICITTQSPLGSKSNQGRLEIEWNKYDVKLPMGQMYVFLEKNEDTSNIVINDRFIMGRNVYEVVGLDDNTLVDIGGNGIIQLTTRITTAMPDKDDFMNGIAYNKREKISDISLLSEDDDSGGVMW